MGSRPELHRRRPPALDREGGWLLDLGDGVYLVTDDAGGVADMRGAEYVEDCQRAECWDETA